MSRRQDGAQHGEDPRVRRITRRRFLSALAAGAAGLALGACGGEQKQGLPPVTGDAPRAGGSLRSALFFDPDNLDPAAGGFGFPIFQKVYSYLHHVDGTDLAYVPDLSLAAPEQPDELTYIFTLRPGVRFQNVAPVNGREVTAEDVAYSIRRLASTINAIDPGFARRIADKIEATGPQTLRITTKRPYASTLQVLGGFWHAVVPREAVEQLGGLSDKAIGSGPWQLARFEQEQGATLVRNPDYYQAGLPYLDAWEWYVITNATNLLTQFRTKALDICTAPLDAPRFNQLRGELDGVQSSISPGLLQPWLGFNLRRPPFGDPRVRQAISKAIDREGMIRTLAFGEGKLNGPIPWAMELWALPQEELRQAYQRDVAGARQLLSAAGVSGLKLTITTTPALPIGVDVATVVKDQLAEAGIDVAIDIREQNDFIAKVFLKQDFDIMAFGWFPVLDPVIALRFFDEDDIFGRVFGFNDPDIARLYVATQATFDPEPRRQAMWELQRAILRLNGPVLNLFDGYQYNLWWPWVHNWRPEQIELAGYATDIWLSPRS